MLRNLPLIGQSHPGINFSRLEVEGNFGGLLFVVGAVVAVLIGLPQLRWPYAASLAGGLLLAVCLGAWSRHSHARPTDIDVR